MLNFKNGNCAKPDGTQTATIGSRTLSPSELQAAAIITESGEGSGVFYYLVGGSLATDRQTFSKPVLLGDRVVIESISVEDAGEHDNGMIVVNYLDRGVNEPMSAAPTKKMTAKYSFQDDGNLIEVLH